MKDFAPLHYRKLRIAEHGAFGQLPFFVRGAAAMILKFCDDRGVFALGGRAPVDAVARKCGAEPSERKALGKAIEQLVHVGYLRYGNDALVVNDQEEDWERIESTRSGRGAGRRRTSDGTSTKEVPKSRGTSSARSESEISRRNYSGDPLALDKIRSRRSDQEEDREGESEGDKPPTIPPPTTPSQQLDRVVGKGPASWGMDGSGSKPKDPGQDQLRTKQALAAPPAGRYEPIVPVVAPKPVQTTLDVSTAQPDAATGTLKTPAKTKGGKKASVEGKVPIPDDFAPNQADYDHGAKYYGYKKEHVDVEAEACRNQYQASGKEYKDWHALFRNFLGWQYEKRGNKPPFVPPPREPKRPMPPTPPMRADVAEAAERIGKEMAAGKIINVRDLFKRRAHSFSDDCETTTSETTTGQT